MSYGVDEELTAAFDKIYEHYKNGEDIYLQCFCKPLPCHCDIIADRLQRKLIKEKLEERKKLKNSKSWAVYLVSSTFFCTFAVEFKKKIIIYDFETENP